MAGCGKFFADRTNVKRHEMIHSGMRPYWCTYGGCSRGYFWRKHLRKHMHTVHKHQGGADAEAGGSSEDDGAPGSEDDGEGEAVDRQEYERQQRREAAASTSHGSSSAAEEESEAATTPASKRRSTGAGRSVATKK